MWKLLLCAFKEYQQPYKLKVKRTRASMIDCNIWMWLPFPASFWDYNFNYSLSLCPLKIERKKRNKQNGFYCFRLADFETFTFPLSQQHVVGLPTPRGILKTGTLSSLYVYVDSVGCCAVFIMGRFKSSCK